MNKSKGRRGTKSFAANGCAGEQTVVG